MSDYRDSAAVLTEDVLEENTPDLLLPDAFKLPAAILMAVLADIFFYNISFPGWLSGLFLILLLSLCIPGELKKRNDRNRIIGEAVAVFVAAFGLVFLPDALSLTLGIVLFLVYRMTLKAGWTSSVGAWITRGMALVAGSVLLDWIHILSPGKKEDGETESKFRVAWRKILRFIGLWSIPVAVSIVFIGLFASANPVFEQIVNKALAYLKNIRLPEFSRIMFWILSFMIVGSLLSMQVWKNFLPAKFYRVRYEGSKMSLTEPQRNFLFQTMTRGLILFNLIFLFQNVIDIEYLWAGLELPGGMTYATYAHRGAYPLIITALLAGILVMLTFQGTDDSETRKKHFLARLLVYIWLGQTIFLVVSAILRLEKYISVYSFTELRFAAFAWMLLVAVGLILLLIRIYLNRNNRWLIHANMVSLIILLLICNFINIRGIIADYNVEHCRENGNPQAAPLDVNYLIELGLPALPALLNAEKKISSVTLTDIIAARQDQLKKTQSSWRTWNLRNRFIQNKLKNLENNH